MLSMASLHGGGAAVAAAPLESAASFDFTCPYDGRYYVLAFGSPGSADNFDLQVQ